MTRPLRSAAVPPCSSAAFAAAALAGVAVAACGGDEPERSAAQRASDEGETVEDSGGVELGPADEEVDGVVVLRIEGHQHTQARIRYEHLPPAGGWHNPIWLNCGFYTEPEPIEAVVHSIEHGAVWLAYAPDLDAGAVGAVRALVESDPKVVATPFGDLPDGAAVVATAWARQLVVADATDPRLAEFIAAYVDADTAREAGGPCEGAYGEPATAG